MRWNFWLWAFIQRPLQSENGGMIIDFYPFAGEKWAIKLIHQDLGYNTLL
jgi:hypothetical protein